MVGIAQALVALESSMNEIAFPTSLTENPSTR